MLTSLGLQYSDRSEYRQALLFSNGIVGVLALSVGSLRNQFAVWYQSDLSSVHFFDRLKPLMCQIKVLGLFPFADSVR